MSITAEKETPKLPKGKNEESGIQKLGQAIRRSFVFFFIATAFLIFAIVSILLLQQEQTKITNITNKLTDFEAHVYTMQLFEKDFRDNGEFSDAVDARAQYKLAKEKLSEVLEETSITEDEKRQLSRIDNALGVYSTTFEEAISILETRGTNYNSGDLAKFRQAAIEFSKLVKNTNNEKLQLSLSKLRGVVKDFIINESQENVELYEVESASMRNLIITSSLSDDIKNELMDALELNLFYFNSYTKDTFKINEIFKDTNVAAHASTYVLPEIIESFAERQRKISLQFLYLIIGVAAVLLLIFIIVMYQLRQAQVAASKTLDESELAKKKAERENEELNDSVISILQAVYSLSQRDLTAVAPVTEDVIGTVSDSINQLSGETAKVLHDVTDIASQVSTVSASVYSQADKVSKTAENERASVQKMVDTLFNATQTMNQVSALADKSNESAEQATTATEGALLTVNSTVEGMGSIRETISEAEKRIKRLGERSQEISGIVSLINTISERTHVLALNASMQAAVAGEAGRGFAVVAEEVQQLAESSRNATEQIATLVNSIQIETKETIDTVNRTIGQVVEGSEQAQQAGEQMRKTQQITAELVASVQNIAKASSKQKEMSGQLLEAVQAIGESTGETAEQIKAQNASTEVLQQSAKDLVAAVNVFKLPPKAS